jgi:hypothetical protein
MNSFLLWATLGLVPFASVIEGSGSGSCPKCDCCGCCETGTCECAQCTCECCVEQCPTAGAKAERKAERKDCCGSGCCGR